MEIPEENTEIRNVKICKILKVGERTIDRGVEDDDLQIALFLPMTILTKILS